MADTANINPYLKLKEYRIDRSSFMVLYRTNEKKLQYLTSKKVLTGRQMKEKKEMERLRKFYAEAIRLREQLIDAVLRMFPKINIPGFTGTGRSNPESNLTHHKKRILFNV